MIRHVLQWTTSTPGQGGLSEVRVWVKLATYSNEELKATDHHQWVGTGQTVLGGWFWRESDWICTRQHWRRHWILIKLTGEYVQGMLRVEWVGEGVSYLNVVMPIHYFIYLCQSVHYFGQHDVGESFTPSSTVSVGVSWWYRCKSLPHVWHVSEWVEDHLSWSGELI